MKGGKLASQNRPQRRDSEGLVRRWLNRSSRTSEGVWCVLIGLLSHPRRSGVVSRGCMCRRVCMRSLRMGARVALADVPARGPRVRGSA